MREQYIDVGASRKKVGARMIRLIEPGTNGQLGGLFYGYPNYERETYSLYPADEETWRFTANVPWRCCLSREAPLPAKCL